MAQIPEKCAFSVLEQFGRRLREERLRRGLDQTDFGKLVAVSKNSQSAYESGKTSPPVEYLLKLGVHGVDIGYVLTGRHADGSPGYMESQIFDMFDRLDDRDKSVVFSLLCVLTDNVTEANNPLRPDASLHSPGREFKGVKESE